MSRAVLDARDETELLTLDRFGRAAMLLDREARVTRMNQSAAALMSDRFRVRDGRFQATDQQSQARINALVHRIRTTPPGAFLHAPMALVCRDGLPWLAIDTLPFGRRYEECFGGDRALLVISNLTEAKARTEASLRAIFGFTPAEARLAAALSRGKSLDQSARDFGVGPTTQRSHLKSIFAKTGTGRQAELVAVLARI